MKNVLPVVLIALVVNSGSLYAATDPQAELQQIQAQMEAEILTAGQEVDLFAHAPSMGGGGNPHGFAAVGSGATDDLPPIPGYDDAALHGTAVQELIGHYQRAQQAYNRLKDQLSTAEGRLREAKRKRAITRLTQLHARKQEVDTLLGQTGDIDASVIGRLPVVANPVSLDAFESEVERLKAETEGARAEFNQHLETVTEHVTKHGNHMRKQEMMAARLVNDVAAAGEAAKQKAMVDNKHAAERSKQEHTQRMQAVKWVMAGVPVAVLASILGYYIIKSKFQGRPRIIERGDTSMLTFFEKLRGVRPPKSNLNELVLSEEMQEKVSAKFAGITQAITKKMPLSNMLFHGPAGTGKTMAAQAFARSLSERGIAHHIIIRGGAFKQFRAVSDAKKALTEILRYATQSKKPIILVFDEAETMFPDRESADATEVSRELTVTLLSFWEKAVALDKMMILSSNLPHKLDRALLNRVDPSNRVNFPPPGQPERLKLLDQYLHKYVMGNGYALADSSMKDAFPDLARRMDGLVGRQIESWAVQVLYRALATQQDKITKDILETVLRQSMQPHQLHAY